MSKNNIGVVGCGAVVEAFYVSVLKKQHHRIGNIYLVDKNIDQARKVAADLNSTHVTDNYLDIVDHVQGVILALPSFLHYTVCSDFLKKGVHVLCEKPLAESPDQIKELIKIADENETSISVNNTRRMFPSTKKVKELVSKRDCGEIQSVEYSEGEPFGWASATSFYVNPKISAKGILLDIGAHAVDLVCWWLDAKPELIEYHDDSFGGPESVAHIRAAVDDCKIDIVLNRLSDVANRYRIVGEKATIEGNPYEWDTLVVRDHNRQKKTHTFKIREKNYIEFVERIFENFIDVISRNARPVISASDVSRSIEFIDDCYRNRQQFTMPWYEEMGKIIE
jgi:predicted dehydrogenase